MNDKVENWHKTACNLCFVNCGLRVQLGGEDGRTITKVRGDEDHPTSKGYICNKASRLDYYQNSSDRLHLPMRRKEDGSYEEIDWDTAIKEVAEKLGSVRDTHGGERIFYYGGGSQGNHLGGAYSSSLLGALGSKYRGSALSQEKTGLAWVFSRMIGGIVHVDVEHAEVAMFAGKNPFMSNGMDQARQFLREIKKDPNRKLIVMDPRRTETADYADIHLAVKPGRDAWCLSAILGYLAQNDLFPIDWLDKHAAGHEKVIAQLKSIPVNEYAEFAGIEPELIAETARVIGNAKSFALEEDIGVQMAPHSTLVTYLNFLLMLLTGNYGKEGTALMISQLVEIIASDFGPVDEHGKEIGRKTLPVTGAPIVSGLYPGAYLAEEILNEDEKRPRALIVESSNPVHSLSNANKLRQAIRSLECSVCIDVAMTETARECDYVLPAPTQYEKWEATFFPRNYPENFFHLRKPILEPSPTALIEPEIHSRLIDALGVFKEGELDSLHAAAAKGIDAYKDEFFTQVMTNKNVKRMVSYVLYRTLGPTLEEGTAATAAIWGLCQVYSMKHANELARAGHEGPDAGTQLYNKIMDSPSGAIIGVSTAEESFSRIPHPDNKLQMVIGELLEELDVLKAMNPLVTTTEEYPFALVAGVRRAYTANCAIRDPRWLKGKAAMALTINPKDGEKHNLPEGSTVLLETDTGQAKVEIAYDDRMHPGTISVPNGQGMRFVDENGEEMETGVFVNELTNEQNRDKFIGTPHHKFVPARVTLL